MRDPERIDRVLKVIEHIWKLYPDMRLGQILVNAAPEFERYPFNVEDKIVEDKLVDFMRRIESCRS